MTTGFLSNYLIVSILIGIFQTVEYWKLKRSGGRWISADRVFATVEFIWFVATVFALLKLSLNVFGLVAGGLFLSLMLIDIVAGVYIGVQGREAAEELVIPNWYFNLCIPLAAVYAAFSFISWVLI